LASFCPRADFNPKEGQAATGGESPGGGSDFQGAFRSAPVARIALQRVPPRRATEGMRLEVGATGSGDYSHSMTSQDDLSPEASPSTIGADRKWFIAFLLCNLGLLGFLSHVTAPRVLDPIMSVPPNRYFHPSKAAMLVASIAYRYQTISWLVFVIGVALAYVCWRGRLDRFNRALIILLMGTSIGVLSGILYSESIPAWVETTYGVQVRERMFEGQDVRLIPRDWLK